MEQEKKWVETAYRLGADFVEFYLEKSNTEKYCLKNKKLESIDSEKTDGLGIRLLKDGQIYYAAITNPNENKVMEAINRLSQTFAKKLEREITWEEEHYVEAKGKIPFEEVEDASKREYLKTLDAKIRRASSYIFQVQASIKEECKVVTILNSDGLFRTEERPMLSLVFRSFAKKEDTIVSDYFSLSKAIGYEMLEELDLDQAVEKIVDRAVA